MWESDVMIRPVWEECYSEWMQVGEKEVMDLVEMLWREYVEEYPEHYQTISVATPRNPILA